MKFVATIATSLLVTTFVGPVRAEADRRGSIYQLDATLQDSTGQTLRLADLKGHPVVISMFYGSCPQACPLLISRIQTLDRALSPTARADTRVILVSFDSARDTPEVLAMLERARGLDRSRWKMVRGGENVVRTLAASLGIKYRRLPNGSFWHTSVITVLDPEGHQVQQAEGPDAAIQPLVDTIESLTAAHPSTSPGNGSRS